MAGTATVVVEAAVTVVGGEANVVVAGDAAYGSGGPSCSIKPETVCLRVFKVPNISSISVVILSKKLVPPAARFIFCIRVV